MCPDPLETAFLQSYRDGRALYELETDISRLTNKLTLKRKRLAEIDVKMRDTGIELVAKDVPTERRVVLLDELRKLGDERSGIEAQIPQFETDLKNRKQRLTTMSNASTYRVIY